MTCTRDVVKKAVCVWTVLAGMAITQVLPAAWPRTWQVWLLVLTAGPVAVLGADGVVAVFDAEPAGRWVASRTSGRAFSLVRNDQNVAFFCVGASGVLWRTHRISRDGFRDLRLASESLRGEAFSGVDQWLAFDVDLRSGTVSGGVHTSRFP